MNGAATLKTKARVEKATQNRDAKAQEGMTEAEIKTYWELLIKATRVYSGQAGKCCCGCSGKYTENLGAAPMVKKVCRILATAKSWHVGTNNISTEVESAGRSGGSRLYIVYFD